MIIGTIWLFLEVGGPFCLMGVPCNKSPTALIFRNSSFSAIKYRTGYSLLRIVWPHLGWTWVSAQELS